MGTLSDAFQTKLGASLGPIVVITTEAPQIMVKSVRTRELIAQSPAGAAKPGAACACSGAALHRRTGGYERAANTLAQRQLDGCRVFRRHRWLGGLSGPWASRRGAGEFLRPDAHKGQSSNVRLVSLSQNVDARKGRAVVIRGPADEGE